jgi:hypothetical protein
MGLQTDRGEKPPTALHPNAASWHRQPEKSVSISGHGARISAA